MNKGTDAKEPDQSLELLSVSDTIFELMQSGALKLNSADVKALEKHFEKLTARECAKARLEELEELEELEGLKVMLEENRGYRWRVYGMSEADRYRRIEQLKEEL